jgi:small subunit ribosomal protein S20
VANIKSQIKRNRQNEVRRVRNRAVRTELKTRIKNAVEAAETGENATEAAAVAMRRIDRACDSGVLHPNTAARRKSRLQKRLDALSG